MIQKTQDSLVSSVAEYLTFILTQQPLCLASPTPMLIKTLNAMQLNEWALALLLELRESGWSIRWSSLEPRSRTDRIGQKQSVTILSPGGFMLDLELQCTWTDVGLKLDVKVGSLIFGAEDGTYQASGARLKEYEKRLAASLTAIKSKRGRKDTSK